MPRPTPTATFVGGPLDGQTYRKHRPGLWAIYVDEEGETLDSKVGDRWSRRGRGCYLHRTEQDEQGAWSHVYRHISTLPRLS